MSRTYLEVTYRRGRLLAAYLTLPRQDGDKSARVEQASPTVNVDYAADGRAIGVELLDPAGVSADQLNALLTARGLPPVPADELAPLARS